MALTEITKVTGPGIHTLSNILSHNINSSGIITATEFDGKFSGNIVGTAATFSGNVTIGGTLTYEDVTNIDSVGIITGKGADINGDLDVDGHTNLDNVSIAGVTTSQTINFATNTRANFASNNRLSIHSNGTNSYLDYAGTLNVRASSGSSSALSFASNGNVNIVNDLDVDGHTNLDNVNVVGVVTASTGFRVPDGNYNTNLIGIGNHEDFIIYHDTAHTYAENKVGDFRLKADTIKIQSRTGVENFIQATYNGSVELFYNGSKKFETTHMGGVLSGILTATTFDGNLSGGTVAGSTGTFTGDVSIADKIVHTGDTNTSIRFPSADTITFETAGSERARFTKDGNLFVGSNVSQFYPYDSFTNDALFMVNGNLPTINGAGQATILTKAAYNASDRRALLSFGGNYQTTNIGSQTFLAGIGGEKENTTNSNFAGALMLYTRPHGGNETERLRITSAGKVLIGHTSPIEIGVGAGYQMPLQVIGTTYDTSGMVVARYQNNDGGPTVSFVKSRNGTKGAQTIVQANDNLGMIRFLGSDGTDTQNAAARIRAFCDGNPASNKIPGRITFETTDTLTYARERMRIDSSGRVVIGGPGSNGGGSNTYIGGGALAVLGTPYTPNTYACFAMGRVGANVTNNTAIANIRLNGGPLGTGRGAEINAYADANWSDASSHPTRLTFHTVASSSTSATERLRIKSDGNITISNTATSPTGDFRMLTLIARSDKQASIGFAQASGVYSGATATGGYSIRLGVDAALELSTHNSNIIALKATQTGNVEMVGDLSTNNLSGKNILINGDMRVAQRATSANMSNHGNTYNVCDRWVYNRNGVTATLARVEEVPAGSGFKYSLKLTTTSAVGSISAGNMLSFAYAVEGQDIRRLGYGSSDAKKATVSFWVRGSLSGKIGVNCTRDSRTFSTNEDIVANTWKFVEIVIPADTSTGFSAADNANGFNLSIRFAAGSNFTSGTTGGNWINFHTAYAAGFTAGQQGAYLTTNGSTIQVTGVQLEIGSQATPFEFIDYNTQLKMCQRYYAIFHPTTQEQIYIESGGNNTHSFWEAPVPAGMRTEPTVYLLGTWTGHGIAGGKTVSTVAVQGIDNGGNAGTPHPGSMGRTSFRITRNSGGTYGDRDVVHTDGWGNGNAWIGYDAEL